jgi:NAD(P)-dependent dehydrogenase (short-subunit alcohol dehydrogenase family)
MRDTPTDNLNMTGRRAVVTGPTSGIGKEIATRLAGLGAEVVLACRDAERGKRAMEEIARRTGSANCAVMTVDMSSRKSIREFAKLFKQKYARLDVLVNNAGVNLTRKQAGADGIETTFATNVLGYFLLTRELLDLLRSSAPARIVNVASTYAGELDLEDLQFENRIYEGQKAYKQSKACDRLLTWALARRLEASGVTVNAMAPGLVQTGLYRDMSPKVRLILRIVGLFHGRSVSQGADTAVWLASSPEVRGVSGKFFELRKEAPCEFRNTENEEKLWGICERLTQYQDQTVSTSKAETT